MAFVSQPRPLARWRLGAGNWQAKHCTCTSTYLKAFSTTLEQLEQLIPSTFSCVGVFGGVIVKELSHLAISILFCLRATNRKTASNT